MGPPMVFGAGDYYPPDSLGPGAAASSSGPSMFVIPSPNQMSATSTLRNITNPIDNNSKDRIEKVLEQAAGKLQGSQNVNSNPEYDEFDNRLPTRGEVFLARANSGKKKHMEQLQQQQQGSNQENDAESTSSSENVNHATREVQSLLEDPGASTKRNASTPSWGTQRSSGQSWSKDGNL